MFSIALASAEPRCPVRYLLRLRLVLRQQWFLLMRIINRISFHGWAVWALFSSKESEMDSHTAAVPVRERSSQSTGR